MFAVRDEARRTDREGDWPCLFVLHHAVYVVAADAAYRAL